MVSRVTFASHLKAFFIPYTGKVLPGSTSQKHLAIFSRRTVLGDPALGVDLTPARRLLGTNPMGQCLHGAIFRGRSVQAPVVGPLKQQQG